LLALALPALGAAFALAPESWSSVLEYSRDALAAGEEWRLWTGHLVHFSTRHAGIDLATLLVFCAAIEKRCGCRVLANRLLWMPPLLSLGLYFTAPELAVYRGASGLCVAFGVMFGLALWRESRRLRPLLLLLAVLFAFKSANEAAGFALDFAGLDGTARVAWQAHWLGVLLALLFDGCLGRMFSRFVLISITARATNRIPAAVPLRQIQENRDVAWPGRLLA
jgi:rhomboid family GlyGly-CTERM serine protease